MKPFTELRGPAGRSRGQAGEHYGADLIYTIKYD